MANRHLLRSTTMQMLYQIDITDRWYEDNLWEIISDSITKFTPELTDISYIKEVITGIISHKDEIDEIIVKYANGWNIDTISPVEKNILRISIFEIFFYGDLDIPFKVSINEAIELSKMFSGRPASKFINGVLGGFVENLIKEGSVLIDKQSDIYIPKKDIADNKEETAITNEQKPEFTEIEHNKEEIPVIVNQESEAELEVPLEFDKV